MEACISNIRAWLIHNRLLINDAKIDFLIIGSSHQLSKISIDSITVGDSTIQPLESVCNLGSWFDTTCRKHWPPVRGPPLRIGSADYLWTGPQTTPTDPSTDHPPKQNKNKK